MQHLCTRGEHSSGKTAHTNKKQCAKLLRCLSTLKVLHFCGSVLRVFFCRHGQKKISQTTSLVRSKSYRVHHYLFSNPDHRSETQVARPPSFPWNRSPHFSSRSVRESSCQVVAETPSSSSLLSSGCSGFAWHLVIHAIQADAGNFESGFYLALPPVLMVDFAQSQPKCEPLTSSRNSSLGLCTHVATLP